MRKPIKNKYNQISESIIACYRDYYEYITTITICSIMLVISMMVASCSPFGINSVINEDGLIQIFPEFVSQINEIKSGHIFPFYTLNIGSFKDTFNMTGMNYIISPWLLIVYRFVPDNYYYLLYSINFFLYFLLSGISIIFYMKHKHYMPIYNKKYLIIIGVSYTLCSYSSIYFRYMAGFKYLPYIPLIILGLEHIIYKNRISLYVITLFLLMTYNPYQAFLACEFIAIFFLACNFNSFKHFITSGIRLALASLAAAGVSSLWLIPYYYMITSSVYSTRDNTIPSIASWYSSFFKILNEYRIINIQDTITTDNSQVSIYCGIIMLLIIPLFVLNKEINIIYKIKQLIILILLFISFNNELLNYIFHGMHYQSLVPNRFAIFFIFILFNILGFINLKHKYNFNTVLISYLVIIFFYNLIYWVYNGRNISTILSSILLVLYAVLILLFIKSRDINILRALYTIIVLEVSINFVVLFSYTIGNTGSEYTKTVNIVNDISGAIPEMQNDFNKTEYLSSNGSYNDLGNATNINTLSYFASDYSDDTTYRAEYYNIAYSPNTLYYMNGNPLADMMLGIKYHIENYYDDSSISLYNKIYTYNQYNVYENPYYIAPMFEINGSVANILNQINQSDYNNPLEYQNAISNAICGKDLFDIIPIAEYYDGIASEENYYRYGDTFTTTINNDPTTMQEVNIRINGSGIYVTCNYILLYLGDSTDTDEELTISVPLERDTVTNTIKESDYKPSLGVINWDTLQEMHDILSSSKSIDCISNGHSITTSVNAKDTGTLYISLPYYEGWTAYVDGEKTDIYRFMGSMGIDITPGQHNIKLVYVPKGVKPALIITFTTLIILTIYATFKNKKKVKHQKNVNIKTKSDE